MGEDLALVDPVQADPAQEDLAVSVQEDLAPVDPVRADPAQEDLAVSVQADPAQEDLAVSVQEDLALVDPVQADPAQQGPAQEGPAPEDLVLVDLVLVDQVRQLRPLQRKLKSSTATMTQPKRSRSKSQSLIQQMLSTPQRDGSVMEEINGRKPTLLVNLELQHSSPRMAATGWSSVQKSQLRAARR